LHRRDHQRPSCGVVLPEPRHYLAGMARADVVYEVPLLSVLDEHDVDQLLQKLRAVHGEARFDLPPELVAATRTARLR
jgi:hypothetical protein